VHGEQQQELHLAHDAKWNLAATRKETSTSESSFWESRLKRVHNLHYA
jgi:hypothetical protein